MKRIIKGLIRLIDTMEVHTREDSDTREFLLRRVRDLINELAITYNAPSNWRSIAEELVEEYKDNYDIYEALRLYQYEK